jgi:hypothetical protein
VVHRLKQLLRHITAINYTRNLIQCFSLKVNSTHSPFHWPIWLTQKHFQRLLIYQDPEMKELVHTWLPTQAIKKKLFRVYRDFLTVGLSELKSWQILWKKCALTRFLLLMYLLKAYNMNTDRWTCTVFVENCTKPHVRPTRKWENNFKLHFNSTTIRSHIRRLNLTPATDKWRTLVKTVRNL